MNFTVQRQFAAKRSELFHALGDPDLLQQCIPECEKVVPAGPDAYDIYFRQSNGSGRAGVGRVEVQAKQPPESYRLKISGALANIRINGKAQISIHEVNAETQVQCQIEAEPEGLVARLGFALFEPVARQTVERFFACLAEKVKPSP
jgi:carbon monoxide dehydrogenase subunit G